MGGGGQPAGQQGEGQPGSQSRWGGDRDFWLELPIGFGFPAAPPPVARLAAHRLPQAIIFKTI